MYSLTERRIIISIKIICKELRYVMSWYESVTGRVNVVPCIFLIVCNICIVSMCIYRDIEIVIPAGVEGIVIYT